MANWWRWTRCWRVSAAIKKRVRPVSIEAITETSGWMRVIQLERGIRVWYEVGYVPLKP